MPRLFWRRLGGLLLAALLAGAAAARGEVYYEIFVRSFQDSDGDGIGDLRGLTERLEYLGALGVDGIWLMPIHPSPSYHGYDVTDYTAVNPDYGTLEDFDALVAAAAARGIEIVLDFVPNHTSRFHPWFLAAANGDPAYRDYYLWSDQALPWRGTGGGPAWHANPYGEGYYLGLFTAEMPDLNLENPAVTSELERIAGYWLGRGAAGFRVDAIQHLIESSQGGIRNTPATLRWVRAFEDALHAEAPEAFLVGETWTDALAIRDYLAAGLDYAFDYPRFLALVGSGNTAGALQSRNPANLEQALAQELQLYPDLGRLATFLGNHDQVRLATRLSPLRRDEARLRLAAGLLFTLPGVPYLYYGEEVGMPNGPGGADEAKRTPMRWTPEAPGAGFSAGEPWQPFSTDDPAITVAAQEADPGSLLNHYRRLIALRHENPQFEDAALELLETEGPLLAFARREGDWRALVLANFGTEALTLELSGFGAATASDLLSGEALSGRVTVDATSLRVLKLP